MKVQLLTGTFKKEEALELLTQLIQVKIKFHENKIEKGHNEDDLAMRERRIRELQNHLHESKKAILSKDAFCQVEAEINIS